MKFGGRHQEKKALMFVVAREHVTVSGCDFSVSGAPLRLGVVFLTVGVLKATQLHVKIMSKHLELAIPLGRNMLILVFMLANYTIYFDIIL